MKRTLFAFALVLLPASTAMAGGAKATPKAPIAKAGDSDCAKATQAGRACNLNFGEGDTLNGETPTGDGDRILGRQKVVHTNLIKLRTSFRDRIVRQAEWL